MSRKKTFKGRGHDGSELIPQHSADADSVTGKARSRVARDKIDVPKADRVLERVLIKDLKLDENNLRKHGKRSIDAIAASLERFGQQRQPVVTRSGEVIAGNGLVIAATRLGWTTLEIVRTELSSKDAAAYAIADNRSAEFSEWDEKALAEVLNELDSQTLSSVGFTEDELKALQFFETIEPKDDKSKFDTDAFLKRVLKQIVLVFGLEQYNLVHDALASYAEEHGLSDHSEVVAHLLETNGYAVSVRATENS